MITVYILVKCTIHVQHSVHTSDDLRVEAGAKDRRADGLRRQGVHLDLAVVADGERPRELDVLERDTAVEPVHAHPPLAVRVALALRAHHLSTTF